MAEIWRFRTLFAGTIALVLLVLEVPETRADVTLSNPSVLADNLIGEQGWSVAVSGSRAIVGAPFLSNGRALVFDLNTGGLLYTLRGSDTSANSLFGATVAIDGDMAIVGCQQQEAAYVFNLKTGQQIRKLAPADPTYLHGFGYSVDISGDLAIVGAPFGGTGPYPYDRSGSAFVFNVKTGQELVHLNGGFPPDNTFGSAVAIDGDTAVITDPNDYSAGDMLAYNALTGAPKWSYTFPRDATGTVMGSDVAIDGNLVAVATNRNVYDMPQVLILDRVTGTVVNRVDTRIGVPNDDNKHQMDLSNGRVVVGSWGTSNQNGDFRIGNATVFDALTGNRLISLTRSNPAAEDEFGFGVAIEGNRVLVGAPGVQSFRGATYAFVIPEPASANLMILGALLTVTLRCRSRWFGFPKL